MGGGKLLTGTLIGIGILSAALGVVSWNFGILKLTVKSEETRKKIYHGFLFVSLVCFLAVAAILTIVPPDSL